MNMYVIIEQIVLVMYTNNFQDIQVDTVINGIAWSVVNVSIISLLAYQCGFMESKLQSKRVENLLINLAVKSWSNPDVNYYLQSFAFEARWRRIRITACGVFPINNELLFVLACSCAMNFCICMQSRLSTVLLDSN
ncbi:Hypothetical predicted protein [Cloeon dipterum]|uniref:Uncharacterized protein n=1 Tax=Cloeon dipterum TaxID=197152 RepID=A0A8S1C1B7_9INSE|nr:Hypothetical predicted protein [Cloeon dipterum]